MQPFQPPLHRLISLFLLLFVSATLAEEAMFEHKAAQPYIPRRAAAPCTEGPDVPPTGVAGDATSSLAVIVELPTLPPTANATAMPSNFTLSYPPCSEVPIDQATRECEGSDATEGPNATPTPTEMPAGPCITGNGNSTTTGNSTTAGPTSGSPSNGSSTGGSSASGRPSSGSSGGPLSGSAASQGTSAAVTMIAMVLAVTLLL